MSEIRKSRTEIQTGREGYRQPQQTSTRNVFIILFRHRWLLLLSFVGIFAVATVASLYWGDRYQAKMMILVENNERLSPAIDAQPNNQAVVDRNGVSVEQLNSEIALLRSQGLLRQVVLKCGLQAKPGIVERFLVRYTHPTANERTAEAVRELAKKLQIQVLRMSDMIEVSYRSSNPRQAALVLKTLGNLYLKKHADVRRPRGVVTFFEQQTQSFRQRLAADEANMVAFTKNNGVVSAQTQLDASLQKLSQFQAMQQENKASLDATVHRIYALQSELGQISPRLTTQVKTSDNAQLLQRLQSTLLSLENQRTKLLANYQPTYRPVREVERQIKQTKAAIRAAQKAPWKAVTTDQDPDYQMAQEELTKARATLAADEARARALDQSTHSYLEQADWLKQEGVAQQNLVRTFKADEDNYLLYLRKGEEARISEALDARRILNVAIAEHPSVPSLPEHSGLWDVVLSAFIAGLGSLGLAFVSDAFDPTVRTPDEAEWALHLPVLAALPKNNDRRRLPRVR